MNQAILFNDDLQWNEPKQQAEVSALYSGSIVQCFISISYLQRKGFTGKLSDNEINEFITLISFDIEEDAQQAIEDEMLTDEGIINLN